MSDSKYQHRFGSIKSPLDLLAVPGYEPRVDFSEASGRRLLEMLDHYIFAKADAYPCGIQQCKTTHQHGYLVRTSDGKLTNIGRICGKKFLHLDFDRVRKSYKEKRKAAANLASISEIRAAFAVHEKRLEALLARNRRLVKCRDEFREWLPEQFRHVCELGRRGESEIRISRRMSKREAALHFEQTGTSRKDYPGGRPYVEESRGRLDGCAFYRESLGLLLKKHVMPPLDALKAIGDEQLATLTPKQLEDLSRNTNKALGLIPEAEALAEQGLRFFARQNLERLALMDSEEASLSRMIKACEELLAAPAHEPV